jgi:hypothetical protein
MWWMLAVSLAADPAADFEQTVKPVFEQRCLKCHGGDRPRAGLDLSSAARTLAGAKSGPVVSGGKPDASLLVQVLAADHDTHMPPNGQLAAAEIEAIRAWVASVPAAAVAGRKEMQVGPRDREHWAFRPLARVEPPGGVKSVDAFIRRRLTEAGVEPAGRAEPRAFLRRLTFNLTGFPPSPDDVERFVADAQKDWARAVTAAVDRLLASDAYGERWARHWLDIARYADTDADAARGEPAAAFRYRDYVIRSLNADKPYGRFLAEQIAGDLLPDAGRDGVIATGFLRLNPTDGPDPAKVRADELDDMVATTSSVALGLTVGCARCHDHKTDPIPQRDYYRLAAVFAGTRRQVVPIPTDEERAEFEAATAARAERRAALEARLAELEAPARDRRDDFDRPADDFVGPPSMSPWWRDRLAQAEKARTELQQLDGAASRGTVATAVAETSPAPKQFLLLRGDPRSPTDEVFPGLPRVLASDADLPTESRRLAFARWLTEPLHPLAARVIVNRVWHYHFGRGLVDTPSNFGPAGGRPTHPELLDWLAGEFIASGGQLKRLHRLIVLSETYQRSAVPTESARRLDPDNRLWSFVPRRRLEAEAIRDAILMASGRLTAVMYGPGARARPSDARLAPEAARSPLAVIEGPQQWRRSVYLAVTRSAPSVMLEAFDAPAPACPCDIRPTTTVPTQSLIMLNAPFLLEQTESLARRVRAEAGGDPAAQIDRLYRITLGRPAKPAEVERGLKFLADPAVKLRSGRRPADDPGPLADLAHVVCNLNEFVWLD